MIAEMLGIPQKTVSNILSQIDQMVDLAKDFKPPLYNIWKLDKQDNATISRVLQSDQMVEMQQKFKPPLSPVTRGYRGKPDRESKIRATNIASASF